MGRSLSQTLVVENVAGAGGTIANSKLMKSPADGYTIAIGHLGTHVIAPAVQQLQVDYVNDLEPLALVATNPRVIVSRTTVPAKDLKEFIAGIKAR